MRQATIRSTSGDAEFTLQLDEPAQYTCEAGFESTVQLQGKHWDGDHTFPLSASVHGLWLRADDLTGLRNHITRWTAQPLQSLVADDLAGEFQLARLPGQSLRIRFAAQLETHPHANPEVHVTFAAGAFQGEYSFVTDQSCLEIFARELSATVEARA